jgi:hypothetical protein
MRQPLLTVVLLPLAPLFAQELRQIDTPGFFHACYDPFRARVVTSTVGGYSLELDGSVWRQTPDPGAPSGFCYVDRSDGRLHTITRRFVGTGMQLDAFERVDHRWLPVAQSGSPPLRNDFTLVYDRARDEVLAFGGYSLAASAPLGDTWVFDGAVWTQRQVPGPTPRTECTAAYDDTRQRVVLFGGKSVPYSASGFNDTWEWNGVAWTQVATATSPAPRLRATMAHDPGRQRMVMVGPSIATGLPNELWEYDGSTWSPGPPLPTQVGFDPRIVHDAAQFETLLLGGYDSVGRHGRVYAWNGVSWTQRAGFGSLPYHSFGCEVTADPAGSGLLMYGVSNSLGGVSDELWRFDGRDWLLVSPGGPSARSDASLWTMAAGVHLFAGFAGVAFRNDLWRWDGQSWTQLSTAVQPPPRHRANVAVDRAANVALLFGGQVNNLAASDTWRFDGAQWQQILGGPVPPPRYWAAMAHDPVRNRFVLHGGLGGSGTQNLTDTWEWNGTAWAQVLTAQAPPPGGRMTFDPATARIVYFVASGGPARQYQVWSYDGAAWTLRPMLGTAGSANVLRAELPRGVTADDGRLYVVDQTIGVLELLTTPARTAVIGQPCGPMPLQLTAASLPQPGASAFGLEVLGAPANGAVAIGGADGPASLPFFGCTLLLAPNQATAFRTASTTGFVQLALPLPPVPTLVGMSFWFQAAALAPTSPNGFTLSAGLRIDLGS